MTPMPYTTNAPPPALFEQLNPTNLVYYDLEITDYRLRQLRETLELLGTLLTLLPINERSLAPSMDSGCQSEAGQHHH